ncbi:MAG: hypothetical protein CL678_16500, partial [Bdellovibrionaceae bacterium]|nr:hypothetical protein [Pseudobdellovibrionaceae bacterium]
MLKGYKMKYLKLCLLVGTFSSMLVSAQPVKSQSKNKGVDPLFDLTSVDCNFPEDQIVPPVGSFVDHIEHSRIIIKPVSHTCGSYYVLVVKRLSRAGAVSAAVYEARYQSPLVYSLHTIEFYHDEIYSGESTGDVLVLSEDKVNHFQITGYGDRGLEVRNRKSNLKWISHRSGKYRKKLKVKSVLNIMPSTDDYQSQVISVKDGNRTMTENPEGFFVIHSKQSNPELAVFLKWGKFGKSRLLNITRPESFVKK